MNVFGLEHNMSRSGKVPTAYYCKIKLVWSFLVHKILTHGDHLVSWNIDSKNKEKGGLGIGNIAKRNEALLGK